MDSDSLVTDIRGCSEKLKKLVSKITKNPNRTFTSEFLLELECQADSEILRVRTLLKEPTDIVTKNVLDKIEKECAIQREKLAVLIANIRVQQTDDNTKNNVTPTECDLSDAKAVNSETTTHTISNRESISAADGLAVGNEATCVTEGNLGGVPSAAVGLAVGNEATSVVEGNLGGAPSAADGIAVVNETARAAGRAKGNMASFSDIESAIAKFSGKPKNAKAWFAQFDSICASWQVEDNQKYFACRRLLTGAALRAIECEDVSTYNLLKAFLIENFDKPASTFDLFAQLKSTRPENGEDLIEYAYRMRNIARLGKLDNESLLTCIIDGLGGMRVEKLALYGATDFAELLEALEVYEKIRTAPIGVNKPPNQSHGRTGKSSGSNQTGAPKPGANAPYAPKNTNVKRELATVDCFKCGNLGHYARHCPVPEGAGSV